MTTQPQPPETAPDWEMQSKRIAAAFGVEKWEKRLGVPSDWKFASGASIELSLLIREREIKYFELRHKRAPRRTCDLLRVMVDDGKVVLPSNKYSLKNPQMAPRMARALVCLGYSTSELESHFNLTITAHERLEWLLEMKRAGFEVKPLEPPCK